MFVLQQESTVAMLLQQLSILYAQMRFKFLQRTRISFTRSQRSSAAQRSRSSISCLLRITQIPQEIVVASEAMGFSSKSTIRPSAASFTQPKRVTSIPSSISLHTTVISAFFSIWYSRTLLQSSLYTPSPEAITTQGSWLFFKNVRF